MNFPGISTALIYFPVTNDLEFDMSVPKLNANQGGMDNSLGAEKGCFLEGSQHAGKIDRHKVPKF